MAKKVYFDTLRSLAAGSISASYAAVGPAFTVEPRLICITNNTEGDMIFSTDDENADGQLFVGAGSFKLFDLTANMIPGKDDSFVLAKGTIIYVKQLTAPASGSVYVELVYGQNLGN